MPSGPWYLDSVIWNALTTRQANISEGSDAARRFIPEISILAGVLEPSPQAFADLAQVCQTGDRVSIWDENEYQLQPGFEVVAAAPLYQMVLDPGHFKAEPARTEPAILTLSTPDVPEMLALTKLTRPGPFGIRTHELGDYLGIRVDGELAAMCGERLRVPGYTEMSAICTHPSHTGKGYARLLMHEIARRILARGETPILHVREDNERAISVYKAMGFAIRHRRYFVVLQRT